MDIKKFNNNFKNRKPKCFDCNKYGHIAKECWKKKEKETRKCFKCNKEEHIVRDYEGKQSIKKWKIQEELDDEDDEEKDMKEQGFGDDLK